MQDEIARAKFVLCIVTKTYAERFLGHTAPGKGFGANWEGSIITSDIYQNGGRNEKFIPIIFDPTDAANLPHPLCDYTHFHGANDYDALYRLLTNQPEVAPHPLGSIIPAPPPSALPPLKQPKVYRHRHDRGNLPRLPYFFGRDHDLDTIAAALNHDIRTWLILIDGPGGIGKTSLAIRAAEIASETDYPRIVFVSSKVRELEPDGVHAIHDFLVSSYPEILNAIARELGNTGFDKLSERNRPSALHTLLREKPALLVIDDLESLSEEDRTRILEFLKHLPTGTKAIITSRRRTDVQAEVLRLERISWDEAAQLLAELARNNKLLAATTKAKRRELYNHTGGNPLILRWVAGQLGRGQCRTVASALEMLKKTPSGEQALEFIFGDLLDTFTRDEMGLLAALT